MEVPELEWPVLLYNGISRVLVVLVAEFRAAMFRQTVVLGVPI